MQSHYKAREQDEYEREDYEEYEEDASTEGEEEEVEEEAPQSQEQQEFLKMREQLKEKYRQRLKKEAISAFGRSQLQDKRKTTTNDNFGSFFGPSQPVIASRVLDERRSIEETRHIISKIPNGPSGNRKDTAYTALEKKTVVHKQKPKVINEVKKKAQTLKDMRDYSFLLSDDVDFPDAREEQKPARNIPASVSAPGLAKSKPQMAKPARQVGDGHGLKNPAVKKLQPQTRVGPGNGAALNKHKPATTLPRKLDNPRNSSDRSIVQKALPSKALAQTTSKSNLPAKIFKDPHQKTKPSTAAAHSSAQKNQYPDHKRPSQSLNNIRSIPNKSLPSSKPQPPKKILPRDNHEDRLKKKPMKRRLDDDDEDAIGMIRKMFGYNPAKYSGVDDDVSDMEADFREIQKEERRSALIAQREDEEQLRLIEEEERRERMRKKQKQKRH